MCKARAESLCAHKAWFFLAFVPSYVSYSTHNRRLLSLPIGCESKTNIMGYSVYWSSSPNANNSNNAWIVNFNNGNDNTNNKNNNNRVRLVRSGEWHDKHYHL